MEEKRGYYPWWVSYTDCLAHDLLGTSSFRKLFEWIAPALRRNLGQLIREATNSAFWF